MDATFVIVVLVLGIIAFLWIKDRAGGFTDPANLSDKDILSAIGGQADWLEKQLIHVAKHGGSEPYPELADKRREYIFHLCETLISRHPEPRNLMYNATKRAAQLEAEGASHEVAVVVGVKQALFEQNGHSYMARWHRKA